MSFGIADDSHLPAIFAHRIAFGHVFGRVVRAFGLNVGLDFANQRAHVALEQSVCDWMRTRGARLFNSGYAANVGVLSTLLRAGDVVISDALNHASIIDGCRLSRATTKIRRDPDSCTAEPRFETTQSQCAKRREGLRRSKASAAP